MSAPPTSYRRFVALGDSQTEGLNDLDEAGVPRGWADNLALRLASTTSPGLTYANLAVRRVRAAHVREVQLPAALALEPDLATVAVGMNDVLRHDFDLAAVLADIEHTVATLRATGCTVAMMTFPDIGAMIPMLRRLRRREEALNDGVRVIAARYDAPLLDIYPLAICGDPTMWSHDRIHGSADGHRRIGEAMAELLGVPGVDPDWSLPARPTPAGVRALTRDLWWAGSFVSPWLVGQFRRTRTKAEAARAKRPELLPAIGEAG
jgi:lysophospholipase L1-like esterase